MGEGYAAVRRGRDHPALGNEKGEVIREIYDGMGGDVEGKSLRRIVEFVCTAPLLSRSV